MSKKLPVYTTTCAFEQWEKLHDQAAQYLKETYSFTANQSIKHYAAIAVSIATSDPTLSVRDAVFSYGKDMGLTPGSIFSNLMTAVKTNSILHNERVLSLLNKHGYSREVYCAIIEDTANALVLPEYE